MAKVTAVKFDSGKRQHRGTFKVESFNMFDPEDMQKYAELRQRSENKVNGIDFELIREYSRKTTTVNGAGTEDQTIVTAEEIILVCHYWEHPVVRTKGDSDEEVQESRESLAR